MKASEPSIFLGARSAAVALTNVAASGPWPDMQLCRLPPPGVKPSALASYSPYTRPMYSLITLRWNQGGRKVSSATIQRGGKITKSTFAVPGMSEGDVSTVKIDGSGWSKLIEPMVMKCAVSYLIGVRLPCHATTLKGECFIVERQRRPPNFLMSS